MDDFDFDPRNWRKKGAQQGEDAPVAATDAENAADSGVEDALPEAWRGIGTSFVPAAAPPPPAQRNYAPAAWAGAALILACTSAAAWTTRVPPVAAPPGPIASQSAAAVPGVIERTLRLGSGAEIASALAKFGIPASDADNAAKAALSLPARPGEIRLTAVLVPAGTASRLDRLQLSYADGSGVVVMRDAAGAFVASVVAADLTSKITFASGEIDADSFYSSAVSAGVPDTLVPEFVNAFGYDFNLASEVAPGDTFEVAYAQSVNGSGEAVGQPELLYAKLTTPKKSLALYRFKQADGTVGWFDGNGATTKRGFMRTPVDGARITSKFGMRFHPTLHYNRLHGGVDFGAPTGTPIYAAANGVVIWAAAKGCNGNLTVIKHDGGYETFYLHQTRWMPEVSVGASVTRGQHIGDVGMTPGGICVTGPHLHYEVHLNGEKVDPLSIPTDNAKREALLGVDLASFVQQRNKIDVAR